MFDQSLVRVRAGTKTDRGGNTVPDWSPGAVDRLPVDSLSIQPNVQQESAEPSRTAVVTGWRVLSEPGTDADIRADDRIEWDGMTLTVQGEIARWPDPLDGGIHHVEFSMERSTG
jgi:hypothetical protein